MKVAVFLFQCHLYNDKAPNKHRYCARNTRTSDATTSSLPRHASMRAQNTVAKHPAPRHQPPNDQHPLQTKSSPSIVGLIAANAGLFSVFSARCPLFCIRELLCGRGALANGADHAAAGRAGGDDDLDGISADAG